MEQNNERKPVTVIIIVRRMNKTITITIVKNYFIKSKIRSIAKKNNIKISDQKHSVTKSNSLKSRILCNVNNLKSKFDQKHIIKIALSSRRSVPLQKRYDNIKICCQKHYVTKSISLKSRIFCNANNIKSKFNSRNTQ